MTLPICFVLAHSVMCRCQTNSLLSKRFSNVTVYKFLFARESAEQIAHSTSIQQVRDFWNSIYPNTPVPCLFGYSSEGWVEREK